MKIVYWILIILILYLAFSYGRFKYVLSHAHLNLIEQKDQTLGTGPKLKYIAAGDSTAVGEGASSVENTYPYQILGYLAGSHTVEYKNVAVIGSQTHDLVDKQLEAIVSYDPDIITISIGANDLTHWVSIVKIVGNYKTIINRLTQETKAKVYITNVPRLDKAYLLPWIFRQYFDSQAKAVNKQLVKLETDRVKFIDIHSVAVDNARDKFHPSDIGYSYWTNAFLSKLRIDYP